MMFNFDEDKLTDEKVMEVAKQDNLQPLRVAINANGYRKSFRFWCSAEEMLCVKLSYKYGVAVHKIKRISGNSGVLKARHLYASVIKVKPFIGNDDIFSDLNNNILPSLQDAGIICRIGDRIYVHPALVGMSERDVYNWCSQYRSDAPRSHYVEPIKPPTIHGYDADEVEKAIQFYRKAKSLLNGEY